MKNIEPTPTVSQIDRAVVSVSQKLMYSKTEAAQLLSISTRTIENLIANKQLACRKIGKRVLIAHYVLLRFTRCDHATGRIA